METTVESVEGAGIPNNTGQQFAEVQPNEFQFIDDKVIENQNMQTQISYTDSQNYNATTDIHEEINRKLEEIANLDNAEELIKTDELISDASVGQENIVTHSNDAVNESTDIINETTSSISCVESVALAQEQQLQMEENEKQQAAELIPQETQEDNASISTSQMETSVEIISDDETEGTNVNETSTLDEKQNESHTEVENLAEPRIDPMELVEDQMKNLVGCESDVANESLEIIEEECKMEYTEPNMQEREDGETIVLTSEQIEITEVDSSDVIESEELHLGYTVVDECDASTEDAGSESNVPLSSQNESPSVEDQSTEINPESVENSEQVVYVQELDPMEGSTVSGASQTREGEDNELFIVTVEGQEVDPLKPAPEAKPKKQKGRKPSFAIPSHVLGIDINNPSGNLAGRLKPRLGVKVPYRNLSSQIVSKKEIEDEIMERFRQKQAQQAVEKSDVMFARKLTQRLASKIVPEASSVTSITLAQTVAKQHTSSSSVKLPLSSRIEKDSDLLAILEGDDDDLHQLDEETIRKERAEAERKVKMMEREIALKQLRDMPSAPTAVAKSVRSKIYAKPNSQNSKAPKSSVNSNQSPASSQSTQPKLKTDTPHPTKKVDVEPQLKPTMVLKTYSRKRKSIDLEAILSVKKPAPASDTKSDNNSTDVNNAEKNGEQKSDKKLAVPGEQKSDKKAASQAEQKPDATTPAHPYVTKSSRIIKKKVIWDPDEVATPRSLIKSPKPGDTPGAPKQTTPVPKPADKKSQTERNAEKKVTTEKVEKKVVQEKKSEEKKPMEKKQAVNDKIEKVEKKTPKKNTSPKKVKRLSEIDRLLMDEGAVNMLYEVKNTEDAQSKLKKKAKTVISIEKAEKELRNKASELLKDLKQNTTTEDVHKTLRRKESPPEPKKELLAAVLVRKMSKDSSRSSVHSPPASPAFPYEASRIIRRHSSSSFSSGDEGVSDTGDKTSRKRAAGPGSVSKAKKIKKAIEATTVTPKVKLIRDNFVPPKEAPSVPPSKPKQTTEQNKPAPPKMTVIKRSDKIVTIKLNNGEGEAYLSVPVLKEVIATLNRLAKDSNCHGVVITSGGSAYCLGLNYKFLVADTEDARKKKASELATQVRDFLQCLLHFPKVLIAGVQGDCIGLGVTMLSLFDMVIASDKAQFSMPYGTFGCVPEAAFLLTVPHLMSHGLATELFYTSSKMSASEVARHGLVTRLCWPEKYPEELKTVSSNISQQSLQSIQAAKKQLRQNVILATEAALDSQTNTLIEHWISDECQNNFANYKMETK